MTDLWHIASQDYRGLTIKCAPGVHAACLAIIKDHVPTTFSVLDLAAGSGAFLARLKDAGFEDLRGVWGKRRTTGFRKFHACHSTCTNPLRT